MNSKFEILTVHEKLEFEARMFKFYKRNDFWKSRMGWLVLTLTLYTHRVHDLQLCISILSPKLKTEYRNKVQYWKPIFMKTVRQFCRYKYFVKNYCFIWFLYILLFVFWFLKLKFTQNTYCVDPKKETLLNFWLCRNVFIRKG